MSKIRSKNTKPEMMLRKALFKRGYRYRINYDRLPGKPDIVLSQYKTVIFVHGCFWHAHKPCKVFHLPKSNVAFWMNKMNNNQHRDKNNLLQILSMGWKVLTVWECELKKKNMEQVLDRIVDTLSKKAPYLHTAVKVKLYERVADAVVQVAEETIPYQKQSPNQSVSYSFKKKKHPKKAVSTPSLNVKLYEEVNQAVLQVAEETVAYGEASTKHHPLLTLKKAEPKTPSYNNTSLRIKFYEQVGNAVVQVADETFFLQKNRKSIQKGKKQQSKST